MSDKAKESDQPITKEKVHESSEAVQKQVDEGIADIGEGLKKYMEQRKQGLRDVHTGRILGDQPVFFDSKAERGQEGEGKGSKPEAKDKDGKGREFSVDPETGDSEYTVRKGDNLTSIAKDYLKQKHKDDPNYKPSEEERREELRDAIKDIAKASGIEDPNHIYIGDKVTIPKDAGEDGAAKGAADNGPEAKAPDKSPDAPADKPQAKSPDAPADKAPEKSPEKSPETADKSPDKAPEKAADKQTDRPADEPIARDDQGRPTDVVYPDGSSRSFDYDKDGNVSHVTHPDGSAWTRNPGTNEWTQDGSEPPETWEGDIKVRDDGSFEFYNKEGEGAKIGPDGSESDTGVTARDANGNPSEITYPNGSTRTVEVDDDGYVNKVTNPDGSSWSRTPPDETWTKEGSDPPETWTGKVFISPDGTYRTYDPKTETWSEENPDGTATGDGVDRQTPHPGEGGTWGIDNTRDDQDRVTETAYEDGSKRTFEYDQYGDVSKMTQPDGTSWTHTGPGDTWTKDGSQPPETWKGEIEVDFNGIVTYKDHEKGVERDVNPWADPKSPDNDIENIPGVKHEDGRASEVTYPDHGKRSYEYDKDGNVTSVTHPDGSTWDHTGPEDTWTKRGAEPPETWNGKISASGDGTFEYYNPETKERVTVSPDGKEHSDTTGGPPQAPSQGWDNPAGDTYKPAGPPGMGGVGPGGFGYGATDADARIDERSVTETKTNPNGSITYKYEGEMETGTYDTAYTGSETYGEKGLVERHVEYEKPLAVKYETPNGTNEIPDVTATDTTYNPKTGNYDTKITTASGQTYEAVTSPDGKVLSFKYEGQPDAPPPAPEKPVSPPEAPPVEKPSETEEEKEEDAEKKTYAIDNTRDDQDRVTETAYEDGSKRSFEYDQYGNVSKMTQPDGTSWTHTGPGDTWTKDGSEPPQTWKGEIAVDFNGIVTYKDHEKGVEKDVNPWADPKSPDGSIENIPGVKQEDGRASEVTYPDYGKRSFEYDKDGNVTSVTHPDGSRWDHTGPDDTWTKGGSEPPETFDGKVSVSKDGTFEYYNKDTGERTTVDPSGYETVDKSGGPPTGAKPDYAWDSPSGDAQSPVAPPGIGGLPGAVIDDWVDWGAAEDYRNFDGAETNADGTTTYKYSGEIETGVEDTPYTASERHGDNGLIERHTQYDAPIDVTYKTPTGTTAVEGVTATDTKYNPKTGTYDTTITTASGETYHAQTLPDGTVKAFYKSGEEPPTAKRQPPQPTSMPADTKAQEAPAETQKDTAPPKEAKGDSQPKESPPVAPESKTGDKPKETPAAPPESKTGDKPKDTPAAPPESKTGDKPAEPKGDAPAPSAEAKEAVPKGYSEAGTPKDNVTTDANGNVSHVEYPNGTSRDLEYDKKGGVKEITYKDKDGKVIDEWKMGKDGKYHQYKPDEKGAMKDTGEVYDGYVQVDQNGDLIYSKTGSSEVTWERASDGARDTQRGDGSSKVEYPDGTSSERSAPGADGSYTEKHSGPKPEDNYEIQRTADGKYKIKDDTTGGEFKDPEKPDVRVERARLADNVDSKIGNTDEQKRFYEDMKAFEERAKEQGLSPEEVAKTYQEISKMMEHKGDTPTKESDRIMAAEQVMDQAANPTTIDQGDHKTCNVTTVEARTYTRNPSEAARLVADVATTGSYTANDGPKDGSKPGTTVTIDAGSMKPDTQAEKNPPAAGERGYASQLFQVTATNIPYAQEKANGGPDIRYEQHAQSPGPPRDNGERLMDYSQNDPKTGVPPVEVTKDDGTPKRSPGLSDDQIVAASNAVTGENSKDIMIDHEEYVTGDGKDVIKVTSEEEFNDTLARMKAEGKLPVIVGVETNNYPFYEDSKAGAAGGSGGGHVVTVTDYDPGPPPKVEVDNQWGEDVDYQGEKKMSVHDLYMATRPSTNESTIDDMEKDVEYDREQGTIDTRKEFDLLRTKYDAKDLTDQEYKDALKEQITEASERWTQQQADGTFDVDEYTRGKEKMVQAIHRLPAEERFDLLKQQKDAGLLTEQEYKKEVMRATGDLPVDKQIDALENMKDSGTISNAEYEEGVKAAMTDYKAEMDKATADGTLDPTKVAETTKKFDEALDKLPPDERAAAIWYMHKQGIISDEQYKQAMIENIKETKEQWAAEGSNDTDGSRDTYKGYLQSILDEMKPEDKAAVLEGAKS